MKGKIAFLLAVVLSCMSLAGCGGTSQTGGANESASNSPIVSQSEAASATEPGGQTADSGMETPVLPEEPTKLSVMGGANLISTTEVALKGYLEQHPNVTIEFEKYSRDEYPVKMRLQLSSGDEVPDVLLIHDDVIPQFVNSGWLMDLTDMTPKDQVLPILDAASKDGRNYGLPNQSSIVYVYLYRQDVYDELGLQPPKTWQEYLDQGVKMREKGYYADAMELAKPGSTFTNYMNMLGGGLFDREGNISLDKGVEALGLIQQGIEADIYYNTARGSGDGDYWTIFNEGRMGAFPGMSYEAAYYLSSADPAGPAYGNLKLAPIMRFSEDGPETFSSNTEYFAVNAKTKNEQAAKHLVQWLTLSEEGCTAFANVDGEGINATYTTGYLPGIQKVIDEGVKPWEPFGGEQVLVQVAKILLDAKPSIPYKDARSPEAATILDEVLGEMLVNGKYTAEQAIEEIRNRVGAL